MPSQVKSAVRARPDPVVEQELRQTVSLAVAALPGAEGDHVGLGVVVHPVVPVVVEAAVDEHRIPSKADGSTSVVTPRRKISGWSSSKS